MNIKPPVHLSFAETAEMMSKYHDRTLPYDKTLELFAHLVKTGLAWTMEGRIGRTAKHLIDIGHLDSQGYIHYEELPF